MKKRKSDEKEYHIEGWHQDEVEFQLHGLLLNNQSLPSIPSEREKKKKKKEIFPSLERSKQSRKNQIRSYHRQLIEKILDDRKVDKKRSTISSEKIIVGLKRSKRSSKIKTFKNIEEVKDEKVKRERIKKEIEEKQRKMKEQAYILRLNGTKFLIPEINARQNKQNKERDKNKEEAQKTFKIDKQWKKILRKKGEKKPLTFNCSHHTLREGSFGNIYEGIKNKNEKIVLKNKSQRKILNSTTRNQTFYMKMYKYEAKLNKGISQDLSSKFFDDHLLREHKK